jgi:hypothetical protein
MNIFKIAKALAYILSGLWAIYLIFLSSDIISNYVTIILMFWNLLINDLRG